MKSLVITLSIVAAAAAARAEDFYLVDGKKVDAKVEALIAKARNEKTPVYRCQEQILSKKGALKNKGQE